MKTAGKKRKLCPACRSAEIYWYAGGTTGAYECKKCGYVGPLVIEEISIKKTKKKVRKR